MINNFTQNDATWLLSRLPKRTPGSRLFVIKSGTTTGTSQKKENNQEKVTTWPNGQGVWLRIRRLRVRVPSWLESSFRLHATRQILPISTKGTCWGISLQRRSWKAFVLHRKEPLKIRYTSSHMQSMTSAISANCPPKKITASPSQQKHCVQNGALIFTSVAGDFFGKCWQKQLTAWPVSSVG